LNTKYKIITIQECDSFGTTNSTFYQIKQRKQFLGITYWCFVKKVVSYLEGDYKENVQFNRLKVAEDYIKSK
jgi:hypothetical protein